MTPGNHEVKNNIPEIIIPQVSDEDENIPAGTFGLPDAENHNVYETPVCQYTTMQFVTLSSQPHPPQHWTHLPEDMLPEGGVATPDFLGYNPQLPTLHNEGKESFCELDALKTVII